jgi:TonB-linked SusC/RagA family outer membrane protein
MKYKKILGLALLCCLQLPLQAQQITLSLSNVTVKSAMETLQKEYGYSFVFESGDVNTQKVISVSLQNQPISEAARQILLGQEVAFDVKDKTVVVRKKPQPAPAAPQQRAVQGVVSDSEGKILAGVSVQVKGSTIGAITGADGSYSIAAAADAVLVFSLVGMVAREEAVGSRTRLDLMLSAEERAIDEVIVVGYGVQRKSAVTGAISQVKAEDMQNRSVATIQQALQGKTSGVQVVQTSGAPGASPAIRVRGYSSNSDMNPLFVVDGVRLSDISGIDPNDIESTEILKDAASAAIYGAQAGNGVLLITTKKGKRSDSGYGTLSYEYMFTSQQIAKIPQLLTANQYADYMLEGKILADENALWQRGWDGKVNTSWMDVAFESSLMQKHSLAFQGANDRGSYYLSLNYLDNDGIVKGDKDTYKRITAAINADYQVKKWLKVGTNNQIEKFDVLSVASNSEYSSVLASVLQLDPLTPDVASEANLTTHMKNQLAQGRVLLQNENGDYYGVSNYYNAEQVHPMIMRDRTSSKTTGFNVNGVAYADFTPIKAITFTSRFGYRLSGSHSPSYSHDYWASVAASNPTVDISAATSNSIYYQWENFANYHQLFAGAHDVSAMVGMSFSKSSSYYTNGGFNGNDEVGNAILVDSEDLFGDLTYGLPNATKVVGGSVSESAQTSYFGRAAYSYKDKYMVQASLRADAYDLSRLPPTNRWGYFPAVSAGWDISKESFMESTAAWLSHLKLRGSWGQNGSVAALGGYLYATDMATGTPYPFATGGDFGYVYGARPSVLGNSELTWEVSEQTDFGLDARFLRDRLTLSVDYFQKETEGLLVSGTTPSLIVGGTASPINAGNVMNKGWEFELGWRDRLGDFQYGVRGNLSTLSNEVTYLHPSLTRINGNVFFNVPVSVFQQGHPVWAFYGYKFSHVDPATGEPVMQDTDGKAGINEDDKTVIGCAIPTLTYGITLTAAYKGFDLVVFGSGAAGNDIFMTIQRTDQLLSNRMKEVWYDGRWKKPGDNVTVPAAKAQLSEYIYSDAMVYDGSYFKIKQIQLGYTLPQQWLKKIAIGSLRVYCSLDDFFTFSKYPGFDPEASSGTGSAQGIDKGSYPISKKVVAGVNITF